MGLYNRFCKRFFAAVIIRLTAQSDSRAPCSTRGASQLKDGFSSMGRMGDGGGGMV